MDKRHVYMETKFTTRSSDETGALEASGYFIVYDQETEIFPGFFEKISKKAGDEAVKSEDVRALFNHDTSMVLGRTTNQTLSLNSDDTGVFGTITFNTEDPQAVSSYAKIKRGDVDGCSFGFIPTDIETVYREDGSILQIINAFDLLEVSPCTFPAYPQTEISARQKQVELEKQQQLAVRKKQIKEKYFYEK